MRNTAVAVLGTGRMGTAMARRLAGTFRVVTWSRGRPGAGDPADAVRECDIVVLALFDAAACREVLGRVLSELEPGVTVVNTSTVGVDEAVDLAELVGRTGASYLHSPVLGSVPALRAGEVTNLAGGSGYAEALPVLTRLGEPLLLADVRSAAALKLLANGVLGDGIVALRDALGMGEVLGVDRADLLDVLQHTTLGRLVTAKRDRWDGERDADRADFTAAALHKDLRLLEAAGAGRRPAADVIGNLLASEAMRPEADVADLCTAARPEGRDLRDARLRTAPGVVVPPQVLRPLRSYALGHATGRPQHFRDAFRPTAHVEGMRDGEFASWDLDTYCGLFDGTPADDEATRTRRVDHAEVSGGVATASMTLHHGPSTFVDKFVLIEEGGTWRIANKVYERIPPAG